MKTEIKQETELKVKSTNKKQENVDFKPQA
jgi:hypothetical protein